MLLLAQAIEPISGGAGWVGAGLLGAVLAWLLLVHIPAKDKQIKDLIEAKDAQYERMLDKFQRALDTVVQHCKEEAQALIAAFKSGESQDGG